MKESAKIITGIVIVAILGLGGYALYRGTVKQGLDNTIKIGFIQPLTGDVAFIGENIRAGVEIAVEEVNAAGGVGSRMFEVIYEDGGCDGATAVNAANKLINIDRVSVIIGGGCSSETLAMAPLTEAAKVVLISPASTSPDVTHAGEYVFRVVPSDSFQGAYAASLMKNNLKKNRVALLSCKSDYCAGIKDTFKKIFSLGGEIVADESFLQDEKDIRSQITRIKNANPEAIYFVAYTDGTIAGIRQIKELGLDDVLVMGADAWADVKIFEELGSQADGVLFTAPANLEPSADFVNLMKAKTGGSDLTPFAARAYDAVKLLSQIMKDSGTDGIAIKDALYGVQEYKGIGDVYTFDQNGDMQLASYSLSLVVDGKAVPADEMGKAKNQVMKKESIEAVLSAQSESGQNGRATLTHNNGKTQVVITIEGEPEGAIQPAHIHFGDCNTLGDVAYGLSNVVGGSSDTVLDVALDALIDIRPLAINAHQSSDQLGIYVFCGNIQ